MGPGIRVLERFVHAIVIADSDDDLRITDDTPVEFKSHGARTAYGRVANVSRDGTIFVTLDFEAMESDLPADLVIQKKKAWLDLSEALGRLPDVPERLRGLLGPASPGAVQRPDSVLAALDMSYFPTPWSRLLWGPPGAGKTFALAQMVRHLTSKSPGRERILVVAPSNVAVDVAVLQIVDALESTGDGRRLIQRREVLRYGYPRHEDILARGELLGPVDLEELSKEIERCSAELRRLKRQRAPEHNVATAQSQLSQLAEKRRQSVQLHVAGCKVVGTTMAGLLSGSCPIVSAGPWQTVIIDEASMVSGAAVLFIASIATNRLLLAGDPRQLGPVFEWNRRAEEVPEAILKWIAQDPYELVGVSNGTGDAKIVSTDDSRLVTITEQRRCHPRLWSFVSRYYSNIQTTVNMGRLAGIADLPPMCGEPPRPTLGILHRDDAGLRLANVAITRARAKLILILDKEWMRVSTTRQQAPLLWDLVFGQEAPAPYHVLPPRQHRGDGRGSMRTESPIETILFTEMQRRSTDLPAFTLQYRILNNEDRIVSRADFAFVEERVAIYCNGAMFHLERSQWQRDLRQRRELAKLGCEYLVFSGAEIMNGFGAHCVTEMVTFFKTRRVRADTAK